MTPSLSRSQLPPGKTCGDCLNYEAQCRDLLKGEKPFSSNTTICYFSPSLFNVPWGYTLPKEELEKLAEYKKHR